MTITPTQLAALQLAVSIAWDGAMPPRTQSERTFARDRAKDALEALKRQMEARS